MGLSHAGSTAQCCSLSSRKTPREAPAGPSLFEILPCPHPGCRDVELRQVHSAKGKPERPGGKSRQTSKPSQEGEGVE